MRRQPTVEDLEEFCEKLYPLEARGMNKMQEHA